MGDQKPKVAKVARTEFKLPVQLVRDLRARAALLGRETSELAAEAIDAHIDRLDAQATAQRRAG